MPLPTWLKAKKTEGTHKTKTLLRQHRLETVCEQARCPNQSRCFAKPVATFMILGKTCSRNCAFCAVTSGKPQPIDLEEPMRIVDAVRQLGLRYVVITSVTRDDLTDGGAGQFARCISLLRRHVKGVKVEILTPDFMGNHSALDLILKEPPDVFNHNLETVKRLYPTVRPQADYERSLEVLDYIKKKSPKTTTKSGIMVGLGERKKEVIGLMADLRGVGCDMLTIGQYLQPTKKNLPVYEYITPEEFDEYRSVALEMGFKAVASGPLVRSSMDAEQFCLPD